MNKGDKVKLIDCWKTLKEKSGWKAREYYAKLANPNKEYVVSNITALDEVYVEGETQYWKKELLVLC